MEQYFSGYDERCDATMTQEMATSAFRFGHTLIRNIFPRMNPKYEEETDGLDLKVSCYWVELILEEMQIG